METTTWPDSHAGASFSLDVWTNIRVKIDLDGNTQEVFVDGASTVRGAFQEGGANVLAALDLFAGFDQVTYFDTISIVCTTIFNDGFESGDTSEWSKKVL